RTRLRPSRTRASSRCWTVCNRRSSPCPRNNTSTGSDRHTSGRPGAPRRAGGRGVALPEGRRGRPRPLAVGVSSRLLVGRRSGFARPTGGRDPSTGCLQEHVHTPPGVVGAVRGVLGAALVSRRVGRSRNGAFGAVAPVALVVVAGDVCDLGLGQHGG